MIFDYRNTRFLHFSMEFVLNLVTSLTLYTSILRFRAMLTKKVKALPSAFSDVITDFSIREFVLHVLTLFSYTGFTVSQNFYVLVTFCKSKFS